MNFDYDAWKVFNDVGHWVAVLGLGVWGYLRTKDSDNTRAVARVDEKLDGFMETSRGTHEDQNAQLVQLREKINHMPTEKDVTHLSNDLATVKAQINGMASLLTRIEHQTNLIHDHLLNKRA